MNEILEYANRVSSLSTTANEDFLSAFNTKVFPKGSFVIKANQVCRNYYFIKSGLTKSHFYKDNKEFIMTFFYEGMFFTEFSSYLTELPSRYMIVALEDTTVYAIPKSIIVRLSEKHHCIEALFSKLYSFTALKMMKRISEMLESNADERYNTFIRENKSLLPRISLGDVAQYIGVSQVTLSRIRSFR